jgi:hypothetical protein
VKALDDVNDPDIEWRIRYLMLESFYIIILIEQYSCLSRCYDECKMKEKALKVAMQAAALANDSTSHFKDELLRWR